MFSFNKFYEKSILGCVFFVPALLLTTNNFSVGFIIFAILISISYLYFNRKSISFERTDFFVLICMSFYFIGAIPVSLLDGSTARYFQGGARLLLCYPIYLALKTHCLNGNFCIKSSLEKGLIVGSLGAFMLSIYQYFILNMPRVDGFLFSINFGYLACALCFLSLTFSFHSKYRNALLGSSILSLFSVIFTLTRGAIFAIPIVLIICAMLNYRQQKRSIIILCTLMFAISSLGAYNYIEGFKNRIDYTISEFQYIISGDIEKSVSSGDRLQFWYAATEAFKLSPVVGLPYKERENLNSNLFLMGKMGEAASEVPRGHAHNQYFEMLASNGVLGLISIITTLILPFLYFARSYYLEHRKWALPGATFVAAFSIFGLTEVPLTANLIGSFYGFMLAVFFANISAEKYHWEQKYKR